MANRPLLTGRRLLTIDLPYSGPRVEPCYNGHCRLIHMPSVLTTSGCAVQPWTKPWIAVCFRILCRRLGATRAGHGSIWRPTRDADWRCY